MTPHTVAQANAAGDCQYVFTSANLIQGVGNGPLVVARDRAAGSQGAFMDRGSEAEDITTGSTRREDAGDVEVESPAPRRRDIRFTIVP